MLLVIIKKMLSKSEGKGACNNCSLICFCFNEILKKTLSRFWRYLLKNSFMKAKNSINPHNK